MTPREIAEHIIRACELAAEQGWPPAWPVGAETVARAYLDLEQRSVPPADVDLDVLVDDLEILADEWRDADQEVCAPLHSAISAITTLRTENNALRAALGAAQRWNTCRECHESPVALVELPAGCAAYPDERITTLCPQHIHSIQPRDGMIVILWIDGKWKDHFGGSDRYTDMLAAAQERAKNAERERDAARARNAAYYTALLACRGTNMGSYYCVEPAEAWEAVAALLRTEEPEASILAEYEARGRVVEAVTTYLEYWEPALPPDDGPSREAADRLNAALDALRAQTTRGVGA